MTDEEMARDYALARQKSLHLSRRDTNLIQLACLHGLKAGRPQWHDLRENPNDLPKTDKDVIAYRKDSGSDFDYYRGGAWFGNANGYESEQPIAWCEIPTFDKE